jgi:hypothetical protein
MCEFLALTFVTGERSIGSAGAGAGAGAVGVGEAWGSGDDVVDYLTLP